jgi:hypothetical protein
MIKGKTRLPVVLTIMVCFVSVALPASANGFFTPYQVWP